MVVEGEGVEEAMREDKPPVRPIRGEEEVGEGSSTQLPGPAVEVMGVDECPRGRDGSPPGLDDHR